MGKERALRLIAEGKTGEAIDCLLNLKTLQGTCTEFKLLENDLEVIYLSNQFHRAKKAYLRSLIDYKDFDVTVNKITFALLELINSSEYA